MADSLVHRGPDDCGIYTETHIGLAARRLSVIDVEGGHQPVSNSDGTVWVIQNGEIYNHREIRGVLQSRGYCFKSRSDTEVLAHAYTEWGDEFLSKLYGMYAIAVWDTKLKRLLLARDPIGVKQLFYASHDGGIIFGSELKALLSVPGFTPRLSQPAVREYFRFGVVFTPGSIFEGVSKLRPGESLTMDVKGTCARINHWDYREDKPGAANEEACINALLTRFQGVVASQMISDVPLGAFLSGGVDSSLVVACMTRASTRKVKTFSAGFEDPAYDESEQAQAVADRLGTEHRSATLRPPDLEEVLPKLAWHYDEPFADSSAVPAYLISQFASDHVTVALSGDGGDELFGGYTQFVSERIAPLVSPFGRVLGRLGSNWLGRPESRSLWRRAVGLSADAGPSTPIGRFTRKTAITPVAAVDALFPGTTRLNRIDPDFTVAQGSPIQQLLEAHVRYRLPDDMLVKVDRASMATSLEVRVPFLDSRLVRLSQKIPTAFKVRGFETKYILKRALCRYLPDEMVFRRKRGFSLPLASWFRGPLVDYYTRTVTERSFSETEILSVPGALRILEAHRSGTVDASPTLYSILVFALWLSRFRERIAF